MQYLVKDLLTTKRILGGDKLMKGGQNYKIRLIKI